MRRREVDHLFRTLSLVSRGSKASSRPSTSASKSRAAKLMESIEAAEEHSAELENKLRQKEAELESIREQAEEQMTTLREQLAQMEDELDVSRSSAAQHAKTEAALMKARSRLEEMADVLGVVDAGEVDHAVKNRGVLVLEDNCDDPADGVVDLPAMGTHRQEYHLRRTNAPRKWSGAFGMMRHAFRYDSHFPWSRGCVSIPRARSVRSE